MLRNDKALCPYGDDLSDYLVTNFTGLLTGVPLRVLRYAVGLKEGRTLTTG